MANKNTSSKTDHSAKDNGKADAKLNQVNDAAADAPSAPELGELPVAESPVKIKKPREDTISYDETEEPRSAPELPGAAKTTQPEHTEEELEISDLAEASDDQSAASAAPSETDKGNETSPDPETDRAVEDIVREESDALLAAEDQELQAAFKPKVPKSKWQRIKTALVDIWKNPKKRKIAIGSGLALMLVLGLVPTTRYLFLNAVGVRASASVRVLDQSTLQPLKNVNVTIHGTQAQTDDSGVAKVERIRLGRTKLIVERRAFAPIERMVTIGWGSNPLGEERLRPTGTQYAFEITDFLSGKGIEKAEAISGDASAFSDKEGKLLLTMEDPPDEIEVTLTSNSKRTEKLTLNADIKTSTKVKMVPARKHVYISRRDSGSFDVYATYIDGRNDELLLKGSGNERDDMVLVPHPTDNVVALVSTREGKHNEDGFLLSDLNIIDVRTKSREKVQSSERIQIVGWMGDRLVYVRVVAGTSAGNPKRNRLMAYHYKDDTNNELASANYFNDVMAVGDRVYYAPSGAYQKGVNVSLFSVKADNSDRKVILDQEVWNMFRTSYDHIALSVPGAWYDYRIGDALTTKLSGEPANLMSLVFSDSPDKAQAIWTENRDGKGVLLSHDIKSGAEKTIRTQSGLKNPARWLDNTTVVYRIKTDEQTADYALSLDGGSPKKITDVTNTSGVDRWYYY